MVQKTPKLSVFDRRNTFHVYVRDGDKIMVKRFFRYITKDSRFVPLKTREKTGILSIAIMQLINDYVNKVENGQVPGISREFINNVIDNIPTELSVEE